MTNTHQNLKNRIAVLESALKQSRDVIVAQRTKELSASAPKSYDLSKLPDYPDRAACISGLKALGYTNAEEQCKQLFPDYLTNSMTAGGGEIKQASVAAKINTLYNHYNGTINEILRR
jgi:hypothetical protein